MQHFTFDWTASAAGTAARVLVSAFQSRSYAFFAFVFPLVVFVAKSNARDELLKLLTTFAFSSLLLASS